MTYGELIKKRRKKQNMSTYKLAKLTGVSETAVLRWESGERNLTLNNADKVFKVLGVSVVIGARNDKR